MALQKNAEFSALYRANKTLKCFVARLFTRPYEQGFLGIKHLRFYVLRVRRLESVFVLCW